ncbi:NAD(P)-dependent oxidoreductase [Dyadobacter luticola]|uniref:NADH-flavin reductase n=1 Tax=Dyadobacter luticola TaxID=1979387 RepID=A0A5R9KRW8_9BACT|nr:NAD(P)H-binding protein [Dyadobacter luticola]TLU98869.1 NADH-flavin reductase [Dyadobacter luticola]
MKENRKIAVLGGGGRTGQYVVKQLVEKGFQIKLLLRNPESFTISSPLIEMIKGDALDSSIVGELLQNCDAVISTLGQRKDEPLVASAATRHILNVIEREKNSQIRYILLAGLNVDTPTDRKSAETQKGTDWMRATFPDIHEDRQKAYSILATSQAPWTLVRVPFIEFTDERNEVKVDLFDCPGSRISAGDIAQFMIGQLEDRRYLQKAPFISN